MEDFLKRMERDLNKKIASCIRGESIIKPFSQVFDRVRDDLPVVIKKKKPQKSLKSFLYADGERSIYEKAIAQFLLENPEFLTSEPINEAEDKEFETT